MLSRRQVVLAAALAPASGSLLAAPTYTAGKEYLIVNPPAPTPPGGLAAEIPAFHADLFCP